MLGRPFGLRFGELPLAPQLKSITSTELVAPPLHGVQILSGANWGGPGGRHSQSLMSRPLTEVGGVCSCRWEQPVWGPVLGLAQGTNPPSREGPRKQLCLAASTHLNTSRSCTPGIEILEERMTAITCLPVYLLPGTKHDLQ